MHNNKRSQNGTDGTGHIDDTAHPGAPLVATDWNQVVAQCPLSTRQLSLSLLYCVWEDLATHRDIPRETIPQQCVADQLHVARSLVSEVRHEKRCFPKRVFAQYAQAKSWTIAQLVDVLCDFYGGGMRGPTARYSRNLVSQLAHEYTQLHGQVTDNRVIAKHICTSLNADAAVVLRILRGDQSASLNGNQIAAFAKANGMTVMELCAKLRHRESVFASERVVANRSTTPIDSIGRFARMTETWRRRACDERGIGQNKSHSNRSLVHDKRMQLVKLFHNADHELHRVPRRPIILALVLECGWTLTLLRLLHPGNIHERFGGRFDKKVNFKVLRPPEALGQLIRYAWKEEVDVSLAKVVQWRKTEQKQQAVHFLGDGSLETTGPYTMAALRCFRERTAHEPLNGDLRVTMVAAYEGGQPLEPTAVTQLWLLASVVGDVFTKNFGVPLGFERDASMEHPVSALDRMSHEALYKINPVALEKLSADVSRCTHEIDHILGEARIGANNALYATEVWIYDFDQQNDEQKLVQPNSDFTCIVTENIEAAGKSLTGTRNLADAYRQFHEQSTRRARRRWGKTHLVMRTQEPLLIENPQRELKATPEFPELDVGSFLQVPIKIHDVTLGRRLYGTMAFRFSRILPAPTQLVDLILKHLRTRSGFIHDNLCPALASPESGTDQQQSNGRIRKHNAPEQCVMLLASKLSTLSSD